MRHLFAITTLTGAAALASCVNAVDEGNVMGLGLAQSGDAQAMTNQCASGPTVKGIDVSTFQGTVDWKKVSQDGVKFAIARISDGTGFVDSKFASNYAGIKAHGMIRGSYQFFEPGESATAQADLVVSKLGGKVDEGDLPPVLDVEVTGGQSASTIAARAREWMARIHDRLGVNGIVYTGPFFWADNVGGANLDSHPLWVAHYGTQCPLVPPTWNRWTFHQFTSSEHFNGISGNVDTDHFNGTLDQLKELTKGGAEPHACVTHHFHGAFCDDDGAGGEADHDFLKNTLDVNFHCANKAGSPAFCGGSHATREQAMFVLGAAEKIPLADHPNAFHDDNGDTYEKYMNAGKAYGILLGSNGNGDPDGVASRNTIATMLYREFKLQDVAHDYFYDDDGDADEHVHNAVAAAGLMVGYDDAHHTRNQFKGTEPATRSTLATVARRAHDKGLVPVWKIPAACLSGHFTGSFCDDDASGNEADYDRLATELGVNFNCGKLAGEPAFCASKKVTRAEMMFVFGDAANIPLAGHPNAFKDDNGSKYEKYLNAAKAFGIMNGWSNGDVKPDEIATRDTLAVVLARMYALPPTHVDYFSDDDGDANEQMHNRCAEAGLFTGFDDGHGGRKFEGANDATRDSLAVLAVRAKDHALTPVWMP